MRRRAAAAGFTLIELLVVLVLVGLLASLAVFTLGGDSRQREAENIVRELYLLMQSASEQAVLNNRELGLLFEDDGYRFLVFNETEGRWTAPRERLFRPRTLPSWLVLDRYIASDVPRLASSSDGDSDRLLPDLVFFSSGETTPFQLEIVPDPDSGIMHVLESDGIRGIFWRRPGDAEVD